MTRTPAADALTALMLEIFRVNGALLAAGNELTEPDGQTSARWQVLGAVTEPRTVSDIARMMGLARQSVQRTADLLAGDGLVELVDNPAHRRAKLVRLTPVGEKVLRRISARQVEWSNQLAAAMGTSERRILDAVAVIRALGAELDRTTNT
jgi:DNA-binding MarR family transcriptional regulator